MVAAPLFSWLDFMMKKIIVLILLIIFFPCALAQDVPEIGQLPMSLSRPVVIASDQSAIPASQSGVWSTGRTWSLLFSSDSVNSVQSGAWSVGRTWALSSGADSVSAAQSGTWTVQQGSAPWAVSQSGTWNINNISGTISLPTGAATAANQSTANASLSSIDAKLTSPISVNASQSGTWNINNISGTVSLPTGAATSANQTTELTRLGDVTETAPASDTASSGLNGRLQRIAQRITSLIGLFPTSLGQKTMANSLAVVLASDQSALPIGITFSTKKTYSAAITDLSAAILSATDVFTITGANGVKTKIKTITFTGESVTNIVAEVRLIKRSSANSGGTSSAVTAVVHDSGDAAASSTVLAYTANPTLGTQVGLLRSDDIFITGSNTNPPQKVIWDFTDATSKPPTLNSSSEVIAINFNTLSISGLSLSISMTWTEE